MNDEDNSQTGLNYELLVEDALRSVVKSSLRIAENVGLPGETHFYITFLTHYEGVALDDDLRIKHPDQMTIVIQHQYTDLQVGDDQFSLTLFFGGKPSPMVIPFQAITGFNDPSVGFGLQFGILDDKGDEDTEDSKKLGNSSPNNNGNINEDKTAEIVSLDTFRKRPTN